MATKEKLPSLDTERAKPLRDWLNERNARCAWQVIATAKNPRAIEGWIVNGRIVVIIVASYGWELYTQPDTNDITSTLIDAERRIGFETPPTLAKHVPVAQLPSVGQLLNETTTISRTTQIAHVTPPQPYINKIMCVKVDGTPSCKPGLFGAVERYSVGPIPRERDERKSPRCPACGECVIEIEGPVA